MKTISFFMLSILLCACVKTTNEKSISLIQYDNAINKLSPTVDLHKDKDVEIFISKSDNHIIYSCIMYRIDNGELKGYQIYTIELNTYDKANYQWVNDSTLTFTLSNEYHNSKTLKVTGYGNSTRLGWD